MAVTKATYWQRGETIDYTNATGAAIEAGAIVEMEALIGVAGEDIPQGATGGVHIEGVFYFPKDTGEIKQGALVSYAEGKVKACEDGGQAVGHIEPAVRGKALQNGLAGIGGQFWVTGAVVTHKISPCGYYRVKAFSMQWTCHDGQERSGGRTSTTSKRAGQSA